MHYVRQHAEEFCIDPTNIATLGFSAGGHLCGSTGTLWNLPFLREYLPEAAEEYRPDKTILCYPVILSHGSDAHNGSFRSLLGDNYGKEEYMEMNCLDKQVGPHNPPAFIWHTSEDTCVHVENSLFFAMALRKYGIPIEMHIYPHGKHGLALCEHTSLDCAYGVPRNPGVERWITEAQRFLFDTTLTTKQ